MITRKLLAGLALIAVACNAPSERQSAASKTQKIAHVEWVRNLDSLIIADPSDPTNKPDSVESYPSIMTIKKVMPMPNAIQPVDYATIAAGLKQTSYDGKMLQAVVNLQQNLFYEAHGALYNAEMRKHGNASATDIIITENYAKYTGFGGQFFSGKERNSFALDAAMDPLDLLRLVFHEPVHGIYGPGEARAVGREHQLVLQTIARHPEFLSPDTSRSLLILETHMLLGRRSGSENKPSLDISPEAMAYAVGLGSGQITINANTDEALGALDANFLKNTRSVIETLQKNYWKYASVILNETERYVQEANPKMPTKAKTEIKRQMKLLRSEYYAQ